MIIRDFPKLESPFLRVKGVVTPEITPGYDWVFTDPAVLAVDKLDGTNVSVVIENGSITRVFNRTTEKPVFNVRFAASWEGAFLEGIGYALQHTYLFGFRDGQHFGELIGPKINGNRHNVASHRFVPFMMLQARYCWRSWSEGKYPKTFEAISEWFKELPSRYAAPNVPGSAEGLVFCHPDGRMAKLRRDMFEWYGGKGHA